MITPFFIISQGKLDILTVLSPYQAAAMFWAQKIHYKKNWWMNEGRAYYFTSRSLQSYGGDIYGTQKLHSNMKL